MFRELVWIVNSKKVVALVQKQVGAGHQNKEYFLKLPGNKLENLKK